jgi:malonyl-CoA decarboxylase
MMGLRNGARRMAGSFFGELLETLSERGRALLARRRPRGGGEDPATLCEALLSGRGEASGVALAETLLARWSRLDEAGQKAFLGLLNERFGPDRAKLDAAIEAYQAQSDAAALNAVHYASEPRRMELLRRLNGAPGGTLALVRMREALLRHQTSDATLGALDADFVHLFSSWFNRGFLVLRRIDWTTQANILQKIIAYEAVHEIGDWDDLRRRIEPPDRRCFAFFHPRLIDEPLIFVEVALTDAVPAAIAPLLASARKTLAPERATTAVFYSISNCQEGLRGISFGHFLIKQVVEDLRRECPKIGAFVTLSPAPGFAKWLRREAEALDEASRQRLASPDWHDDPAAREALRAPLLAAAARYFLFAKNAAGRPADPVARFHLGNGARLERLNFLGDVSAKGLAESYGLMVNYLYKLDEIEDNHEAYAETGEVAASSDIKKFLRADAKPLRGRPGMAENAASST